MDLVRRYPCNHCGSDAHLLILESYIGPMLTRKTIVFWGAANSQGKVLGCPKLPEDMHLQESCTVCGVTIEVGWVACPFCGLQQTNFLDPNLSIIEHAQSVCSTNCQSGCGSKTKKLKSKCCKRYKKKTKKGPCKRCPKKEAVRERLFSL